MNDNPLLEKSLGFAARIVKLNQYLVKEKRETVISKQIVRSGTSIGANANEAVYGVSTADFISKLQISLKETAETEYWLRLLILSGYIEKSHGESMLNDCLEIKKILISSLKTAKGNNKLNKKE
ncbi:MAG: four helix bundle protein [Oscillospiraceae bacterium]|nr:four helix bundle protein [Oscillospiraceae bacterium]